MIDRRKILAGFGTTLGATAMTAAFPNALWAAPIKPDEASALLVIDVQNCFLPGGSLAVKDGEQVLWPDHCVQGTDGASLSKDLSVPQAGLIIRKGFHKDVDSYSAFTEADGKTTTGLAA